MEKEKVFTQITQIGIVTADIRKMIQTYEEKFGIGPFEIVVDGERGIGAEAQNLMVYGKPQKYKVIVACCQLGAVQIELIQPLDEFSIYSRHLKEHGEGVINHISITTNDNNAAFREVMKAENVPAILTGDIDDPENGEFFEYFDCGELLGTIVELHDPK